VHFTLDISVLGIDRETGLSESAIGMMAPAFPIRHCNLKYPEGRPEDTAKLYLGIVVEYDTSACFVDDAHGSDQNLCTRSHPGDLLQHYDQYGHGAVVYPGTTTFCHKGRGTHETSSDMIILFLRLGRWTRSF
jgi:hypothetical protein